MAGAGGYDDRDGYIWMDGDLVEWRSAQVHLLTHALHYGGAVFEGERAYGGRIFKSEAHSQVATAILTGLRAAATPISGPAPRQHSTRT